MEAGLKQRLVGAAVLVFIAVVVIPIVLDEPREHEQPNALLNIPPEPVEGFDSSAVELPELASVEAGSALREDIAEELRAFEPVLAKARDAAPPVAPVEEVSPEAAANAQAEDPDNAAQESSEMPPAARTAQPRAATENGWVVQLASFRQPANARALRERLRARDYMVFLDSVAATNGTITRVYIGPFSEQAEARSAAVRLRQQTSLEGIVIAHKNR